MTKKHYEAIASIVKLNFDGTQPVLARDLADYFEQDNPKFDRARFLEACGVETCKHTDGWSKCRNRHLHCISCNYKKNEN